MNSFYNKKKKGYTLAEVLATVAILLILMAIAVPAIFAIRKNLRQKALDNKAELIYTAVQNNLVKLQNNGNSSLYAKEKASPVTANPSDADGDKSSVLYYVTSDKKDDTGNAASVLVTKDTIDDDLYNHYWVIEYNPDSASVYAVFYSETRNKYDTVTYNNLRYKKARLADGAEVGYYGGDMISGGSTSTLQPTLTITNEEKLIATISCKRPDANDLLFEVTLTDGEGHSLTLKYKPLGDKLVHQKDDLNVDGAATASNEVGTVRGIRYELKLTLDDLEKEELRFKNLYSSNNVTDINKKLTPGTALTIKATVKSSGAFADSAEVSATTNSLFADSSTENQADILYGRHLQNLDSASGVTAKITDAVQKRDIHFENQDDVEEGTEDTSSWYSCYGEKTFTPITNNYLKTYSANYTDEANNTTPVIYHLTVQNQPKAGLFATLAPGITVDTVRLSGANISGDGSSASTAGALAGDTAGDADIKNCQVFLSKEDVEGKSEENYWITNASVQGGLIGTTNGKVTIDKSFAATVMGSEGTDTAGGLVGIAQNKKITITSSYADSYIKANTVGGLIAYAPKGADVSSCYTVGYLAPKSLGGGFLAKGNATSINVVNCYTGISWVKFSPDQDTSAPDYKTYSVAPAGILNSYYIAAGNTHEENTSGTDEGRAKKVEYDQLSNRSEMISKLGTDFTSSVPVTNAYNLRNQGLTGYSYPALKGLPHYGDWQADFEAGSLVYYEVYEENGTRSYGFFGGNVSSTLSDSKTIIGDGYGIAYEAESTSIPETAINITYQDANGSEVPEKISTTEEATQYFVDAKDENGNTKQYVIFPLRKEIVNAAAIADTFYQKLTIYGENAVGGNATDMASETEGKTDLISGDVYYYNPHFAETAVSTDEVPTVSAISVRTARQLYHLSLYYPDYAEKVKNGTFIQEVDIDYSTYNWKDYANVTADISVQEPIGARGTDVIPFTSTYNGNCYKIQGISFSTNTSAVGFIGQNSKLVQNVFLVSDYSSNGSNPYLKYQGTIGTNKTIYMGVLTGINSGRIQNCAVSGYAMSGSEKIYVRSNGNFYFGGLTGSNRGTIVNCEADTPFINSETLYGNAYIAGFAGENASGGIIRNSYAIGHIMVEEAKGGKTVISGFVSRNAGALRGDYCAVALTASGETTTSYGFSPRGNTTNCSYLSGGTFRYLGTLYAFDNSNGGGTKTSYKDMAVNANPDSDCNSATGRDLKYPFKTVVTDAQRKPVHFGNWEIKEDLGAIGIVYWELEQGGSNDGYHFSYIGYNGLEDSLDMVGGSTLCRQHDDGGIITEYGYGYYFKRADEDDGYEWTEDTAVGNNTPKAEAVDNVFKTGNVNADASRALTNRLAGFTVVAYTTKPSIGVADSDDYMRMITNDSSVINGVWKFTYQGFTYTFTINPFFANAMQYGTATDNGAPKSLNLIEDGVAVQANTTYPMPGTEGCEYEIRSDDQLQYMNWNCNQQNATTAITSKNTALVEGYTYLGTMYTANATEDYPKSGDQIRTADYYWNQTHDVNANMTPVTDPYSNVDESLFTPIGSLYDSNGAADGDKAENANAYMAYFNGHYNGNTYYIKNVEINSGNVSVGLFGSIIGAKVSDLILYSDKGNYIQRTSDAKTWYVIGGLCGIAAVGQGNEAGSVSITNCTVSGYNIKDNSTKSAWGDACVGGMFGMSTMKLEKCSAVNTIILNTEYTSGYGIKTDGVSVRTGGLVGSMRGEILNCYTGGKIELTDRCLRNAHNSSCYYGSKIYLGGITGGICMKSGNFLKLLGTSIMGVDSSWSSDTGKNGGLYNNSPCRITTTRITNCYTYIKMPLKDSAEYNAVKSIEPIGSNGETPFENNKNYHVKVEVNNCYYYVNNIDAKHLAVKDADKAYSGYINGDWKNGERYWTNIEGEAIGLTWKQMAGQETYKNQYFLDLINPDQNAETKFSTVTTSENGQDIDGKYSFPGNHTELEGENYPFPTILKQSGSINVHYGEWPKEGIYWEESRATMDIFEDLQLSEDGSTAANDGWAEKEFILEDPVPVLQSGYSDFQFSYSNGENDTQKATATFSDNNGEEAVAVFSDGTDSEDNTEEFSSGSTDGTDEVYDSGTGTGMETEEPGTVKLSGDDLIAEVTGVRYDTEKKNYVVTVRALKTGATIITVTARDTAGNEYRASFNVSVSAELSVYAEPENLEMNKGESKSVTVHAVATALRSANISTAEADIQPVGSDGWVTGGDAEEMASVGTAEEEFQATTENSEYTADDSSYVDIVTDGDADTEVFASTMQTSAKELASRMQWSVVSGDPDVISCTAVSGNKFTVQCYDTLNEPVSLTVTGTYTYNGIDYSEITWVEVTTVKNAEIRWQKETETIEISGTTTATNPNLYHALLEDKSGCLSEVSIDNFKVDSTSVQQTYADDGTMVQAATDVTAVKITAVEKISDGYNVTIAVSTPGTYTITFSGKGKDNKDYSAVFTLIAQKKTATASDVSDATDDTIAPDSSQEDSGFTSDEVDNWDDQSSDSVDMIPDQNTDDFSDESSGWES